MLITDSKLLTEMILSFPLVGISEIDWTCLVSLWARFHAGWHRSFGMMAKISSQALA